MTDASYIPELHGDRFDRVKRIEWWNQERLSSARILVVGAGALGNEVLKNLALLGVGQLFIVDLDTVDLSNLCRSVLFRQKDMGEPKAKIAAESVRALYPESRVRWLSGDAIYDLGLGLYRWAQLVVAGVDNREARLHVNRACYRVGRPFIDAATEGLRGVVRVFRPPRGACYECTLSAGDWNALRERRGCAGMKGAARTPERVPTTPVTASVIAALQCQEALKLLHELTALDGEGLVFDGVLSDLYRVRYPYNEECTSHESFEEVVSIPASSQTLTANQLLLKATERFGTGVQIELRHETLAALHCGECNAEERIMRPLESVPESEAACQTCGKARRPLTFTRFDASSPYADLTLADLGVPAFDIVSVRREDLIYGFELAADVEAVLGEVSNGYEPRSEQERP